MVKTYRQLQSELRGQLTPTEGEDAGFLAKELMCFHTGMTAAELLRDGFLAAPDTLEPQLLSDAARLLKGEPLAYLLGEWDFYGLTLKVTPDTLIPRDDTVALAELAIEAVRGTESPRVLDLCTGTGCVGLAIAAQNANAQVVLADISEPALAVAEENIRRCKLADRVKCIKTDVLRPYTGEPGCCRLITANPPYITGKEMQALPHSVSDFEPHSALYGGEDGLLFFQSIAENFRAALCEDGLLCFEFGKGQETAVSAILEQSGYTVIKLKKDIHDVTRAVLARVKERKCDYGNKKTGL